MLDKKRDWTKSALTYISNSENLDRVLNLTLAPRLNELDKFIYLYLIKSWVLVGVTVLLWIVMFLYILRLVCRLSPRLQQHLH